VPGQQRSWSVVLLTSGIVDEHLCRGCGHLSVLSASSGVGVEPGVVVSRMGFDTLLSFEGSGD
jgi:hypothetical protein